MTIETFSLWIIDKIIHSKGLKLATDQDKSAIISELKLAIIYTERHIEKSRNKVTELDLYSDELVVKWNKVAQLIRPYDSDLARIFDSKSEYWVDPARFKDQIKVGGRKFDFRFRLSEVKKIEFALNRIWFP